MRKIVFYVLIAGLAGCAHVPVEVRTAMEKQAAELQQIKSAHKESVDLLFGQIRVLQSFILQELEDKYRAKYASGPRGVQLKDGTPAAVYHDVKGAGLPPSGNPSLDMIALSQEKIIVDYFAEKRKKTLEDLEATKAEFMKLQDHIVIAQQINAAVTEYLDSLVNLRRAQDELGKSLVAKVGRIPGAAAFASNLINIVVPTVTDLEARLKAASGGAAPGNP